MKIGIYTLGCKVNQYETQAMEQELTARGHELVDFESPADAYIINTCSVTAVSDKKSRQMLRGAKKNSRDAVVAGGGLAARRYRLGGHRVCPNPPPASESVRCFLLASAHHLL